MVIQCPSNRAKHDISNGLGPNSRATAKGSDTGGDLRPRTRGFNVKVLGCRVCSWFWGLGIWSVSRLTVINTYLLGY